MKKGDCIYLYEKCACTVTSLWCRSLLSHNEVQTASAGEGSRNYDSEDTCQGDHEHGNFARQRERLVHLAALTFDSIDVEEEMVKDSIIKQLLRREQLVHELFAAVSFEAHMFSTWPHFLFR